MSGRAAKVPDGGFPPEIIRALQKLAQGVGGVSFPLSPALVVPDLSIRSLNIDTLVDPLTWPAANRAIYVPFTLPAGISVSRIGIVIGPAGGNIDYGIYNEDGGALFRNGGHAATANTFDSVPVNISLASGFYYIGISADGTLIKIAHQQAMVTGNTVSSLEAVGIRQQASAYPLPASATFATPASVYIPILALELASSG